MRLLFIRHAEPDYATDSLTEKGRREAALLAKAIPSLRIDHCFVSPLGRARETASLCLNPIGKEAQTMDWLEEFDAPVDLNLNPELLAAYPNVKPEPQTDSSPVSGQRDFGSGERTDEALPGTVSGGHGTSARSTMPLIRNSWILSAGGNLKSTSNPGCQSGMTKSSAHLTQCSPPMDTYMKTASTGSSGRTHKPWLFSATWASPVFCSPISGT